MCTTSHYNHTIHYVKSKAVKPVIANNQHETTIHDRRASVHDRNVPTGKEYSTCGWTVSTTISGDENTQKGPCDFRLKRIEKLPKNRKYSKKYCYLQRLVLGGPFSRCLFQFLHHYHTLNLFLIQLTFPHFRRVYTELYNARWTFSFTSFSNALMNYNCIVM